MSLGVGMEFSPEQEIVLAVEQLQHDVQELRNDMDKLKGQVSGGDDPTKGLLWVSADLGKLIATLTGLVAQLDTQIRDHAARPHAYNVDRHDAGWSRWAYDVSKSAAIAAATFVFVAVLGWVVLGIRVSLQAPVPR